MVIEIPIEVRVKEREEIKKIIKDIERSENKLQRQKPGSNKKDLSSSQAVPTLNTQSQADITQFLKKGGRKDPLGLKPEPKQVVTTANFEKIFRDKLVTGNKLTDIISGKSGPGGALDLLPKGGKLGKIGSFAARLAPPMAVALIAIGFVKKIIDIIFGPGGPLDKRFNEFEGRVNKLFSTIEEAEKKQGNKIVRITSYYGSRGGENTTFNTLDPLSRGENLFSRDINLLSKGLI